jgi:hypothetical protein
MALRPIGAAITYKWITDPTNETLEGYVSFGEYDEATNRSLPDGADDDQVFYYCSPQELEELLTENNGLWQLLSVDQAYYEEEA